MITHDKCQAWEAEVARLKKENEQLRFYVEQCIIVLESHLNSEKRLNDIPMFRNAFIGSIRTNEEFIKLIKTRLHVQSPPSQAFDYQTGLPL